MKVKQIIKKFDLFGEPVTLCLSGKKKFQTVSGSFFSLLMLIVIIAFSTSKIDSVVNRTTVNTQNKDEVEPTPPKLNFYGRFAITLTPYGLTSLVTKRYFDFFGIVGSQITLDDGEIIKNRIQYDLRQCSPSDFPMFSESYLVKQGLNYWHCFNVSENDDLETMGTFNNDLYQYIQINITRCSNDTNRGLNNTCASDEDFNNMITNNPKIYINLVILNTLVDLTNHDNVFSYYFDYEAYLLNVNDLYIQREFYFTPIVVKTDENRFFVNPFSSQNYADEDTNLIYEGRYGDLMLFQQQTFNDQILYSSMILRTGITTEVYFRSYQTFQDILQTFGSFFSLFFMFFKGINQKYAASELAKKLAIGLYSFEEGNPNQKEPIKKYNTKNKENFFQKIMLFFRKRAMARDEKKKKKTKKRTIIDKIIKVDLDVIKILRKIQQLEIIESLIFSKDQKILLNYTAKPNIYDHLDPPTSKELKKISISPTTKNYFDLKTSSKELMIPSVFLNTRKAFQKLKGEKHNEINAKIFNILDPDIINLANRNDCGDCEEETQSMKNKKLKFSKKKTTIFT